MQISPEGTIGIVLALIGLAGAGAMMVFPAHTEIGWILIALACAGLTALGLYHFRARITKIRAFGAMIIAVLLLLGLASLMRPSDNRDAKATIEGEFDQARQPALGNPLGKIEMIRGGMYQASHEQAMIIALLPALSVFVFPKDSSKKAIRYRYVTTEDDRKWWDDAFLRSRFQPPKDKGPPEFRVAELWIGRRDR